MLKTDTEFNYEGYGRQKCRCGIRIHELGGINAVVMTELDDNPGTSVTNGAELLASQICDAYGLDPNYTIFIEHYVHVDDETYDLVMFGRARGIKSSREQGWSLVSPKWKRLTEQAVHALVGGTP